MKCEDCEMRMVPFFSCKKYRWLLDDGKTVVEGCNMDGHLPPIRETNEPKDAVGSSKV